MMKILFAFIATIFFVNVASEIEETRGFKILSHPKRMYGGVIPTEDEWPWLVRIFKYELDTEMRVGAIVSKWFVLTDISAIADEFTDDPVHSRHQFKIKELIPAKNLTVRAGEFYLNNSWYSYNHQNFSVIDYTNTGNFAMMWVTGPIKFNEYVRPICLPSWLNLKYEDLIGKELFIAGWGLETCGELEEERCVQAKGGTIAKMEHISVQVISTDYCFKEKKYICAKKIKGEAPCGERGAPFMYKFQDRWYFLGAMRNYMLCNTTLDNIFGPFVIFELDRIDLLIDTMFVDYYQPSNNTVTYPF